MALIHRRVEENNDDDDNAIDDGGDDEDRIRDGGAAVDEYNLPVTHELLLKGHTKAVSAIAVDRAGSRVVTGSNDYSLRLWDFNGMKRDCRSFRELSPMGDYPIHSINYSPTGDAFFVVAGSPRPKVFDRDGRELVRFISFRFILFH
jgi:WD40 repeat protein